MQSIRRPRRGLVVDAKSKKVDTKESRRRDGDQARIIVPVIPFDIASIYGTHTRRIKRCAICTNAISADYNHVRAELIDVCRCIPGRK